MGKRFDPQSYGSADRYLPTEPGARPESAPPPRDSWPGPPYGPPPYPGVYPPPPEFYLPRRQYDTVPPPPPEHAGGAASLTFAPDGRMESMRLPGTAQSAGGQQRTNTGSAAGGSVAFGPLNALLPLGSALLSFALYTLYGGWEFGLGLVLLLLVHEMGHFVVIRAKGMPAALPVFIPFLGAYVAMRRMPQTVRDEAEIGIAGPLAGALGGAACFLAYEVVGEPDGHILLFLAYFSFLINLLNLLPVSPLDGGHIVGAISRWLWPLGLVLLAAAFFHTWNLLLLVLGWLWFYQTIARFRMSYKQPYYDVSVPTRLYVSVLYFGLAIGLGLALYLTQTMLPTGGFFGQ